MLEEIIISWNFLNYSIYISDWKDGLFRAVSYVTRIFLQSTRRKSWDWSWRSLWQTLPIIYISRVNRQWKRIQVCHTETNSNNCVIYCISISKSSISKNLFLIQWTLKNGRSGHLVMNKWINIAAKVNVEHVHAHL